MLQSLVVRRLYAGFYVFSALMLLVGRQEGHLASKNSFKGLWDIFMAVSTLVCVQFLMNKKMEMEMVNVSR